MRMHTSIHTEAMGRRYKAFCSAPACCPCRQFHAIPYYTSRMIHPLSLCLSLPQNTKLAVSTIVVAAIDRTSHAHTAVNTRDSDMTDMKNVSIFLWTNKKYLFFFKENIARCRSAIIMASVKWYTMFRTGMYNLPVPVAAMRRNEIAKCRRATHFASPMFTNENIETRAV